MTAECAVGGVCVVGEGGDDDDGGGGDGRVLEWRRWERRRAMAFLRAAAVRIARMEMAVRVRRRELGLAVVRSGGCAAAVTVGARAMV